VRWAKKAKEEHDVFAEILRDQGIRVHYFTQLLAETPAPWCLLAPRTWSPGPWSVGVRAAGLEIAGRPDREVTAKAKIPRGKRNEDRTGHDEARERAVPGRIPAGLTLAGALA